ncbi:MAG TPA: LuxR C-terminal-related transcriptional regulator [Actinomycetota bacterium]|nr:LuxR C-terminal-related transcriptional regulator [Actinomycetota bacterium]
MLTDLGLTSEEEQLYRWLLGRLEPSTPEMAASANLDAKRPLRTFEKLESKGLVSRLPSEDLTFSAVAPDVGLEPLLHSRTQELLAVKSEIESLQEDYRRAARQRSEGLPIHLVRGVDAVAMALRQVANSVTEQILVLDRPPYAIYRNPEQLEHLERGIRYRTIYDRQALEDEGYVDWILTLAAAGERARVLDKIPMKMMLVDKRRAMLPLDPGRGRPVDQGLIVESPEVIELLSATFESLWSRAVPMEVAERGGTEDGSDLGQMETRILMMMSAGIKDRAIANQLGVGHRTVQRKIQQLMQQMGASTRFQAGIQAAHQGWIKLDQEGSHRSLT